jgi:hypothetical protein
MIPIVYQRHTHIAACHRFRNPQRMAPGNIRVLLAL